MAITSIGVGSGLDLESLVNNLITAERTPRETTLKTRESSIKAEISAFGTLKSDLSKLADILGKLNDTSDFDTYKTTVSDSDALSVSTSGSAAPGQYRIDVLNLAQSQAVRSDAGFTDSAAVLGIGELTFTNGNGDTFKAGTTETTSTLADLRDAINSAPDNFGVTASLVTVAIDPNDISAGTKTELVLSSDETGTENAFEISNTSGAPVFDDFTYALAGGGALIADRDAADAKLQLDEAGTLFALSGSNTFTDVIEGVSITAKKVTTTGAPVILDTTLDTDSISANVKAFVDSYNAVQKTIRTNSNYGGEEGKTGPFSGDFTVRSLRSQLQGILGESYNASGEFNSLSSLGISTNKDGTLALDSNKLEEAVASNADDVTSFFAGASGFAERLQTQVEAYSKSGGMLASRTDGLNSQLSRISDQREQLDLRMERLEKRYRDQFTALDLLVSSLQSTGSYLAGQLSAAAKINGA